MAERELPKPVLPVRKVAEPLVAKRRFTSLNHPEPDPTSGVQLYSVYEVFSDKEAPHGRRYVVVADYMNNEEVEKFITNNGEWDA